jgi:uncharacterized GH25 family protein
MILVGGGTAAAHYTYVMPDAFTVRAGDAIVVGFHSGDGFPESSAILERLQEPTVRTDGASTPIGAVKADGKRLVASVTMPAASHVILTAVNAAAVEQMKGPSFEKYLAEEGLHDIIKDRAARGETEALGRERYSMYAKAILATGAAGNGFALVTGLPIEIVPEKDPYRIPAGEQLPVRVLLKGKPVSGALVVASTVGATPQAVGRTDDEGRLSVPVSPGKWRLHTIAMERVEDPAVDWESFWATLTFEAR